MAPSKRDAPGSFETEMSKTKKPRSGEASTATVAAMQTPIRNRHLEAVLSDHIPHHNQQNGHHSNNRDPADDDDDVLNSSYSSPTVSGGRSNQHGGALSKRVSLNRSAIKHQAKNLSLSTYAAKTPDGGVPGTPNDQQENEPSTPVLSRVEYNNNLKSLHEINSKNFNPKLAFSYNFINIMNNFIHSDKGNVDFKLIALSLDAGTRVYTSKVDVYIRNMQKVSNSLSMATGDEKNLIGGMDDFDDEDGLLLENTFLRNEKKKAAKKRKKVAPTIVPNPEAINGKYETNIAVDPLFHHFSAAFDVGNVSSLLMANLNSDPVGALLLDSAEKLNFSGYSEGDVTSSLVNLSELPNLRDLETLSFEETSGSLKVCPVHGSFNIADFSFNDRDASMDFLLAGGSKDTQEPFVFDADAPVDDVEDFDLFSDDDNNFNLNDHNNNDSFNENNNGENVENNRANLDLHNASLLVDANLMKILPANQNEFFNRNFLRQVFRKVPFFKGTDMAGLLARRNEAADGEEGAVAVIKPKAKRTRPAFVANPYETEEDQLEELFVETNEDDRSTLSFGINTLNRWSVNSELIHLKDDFGFDTHCLKVLFTKPKTYFNDLQREKALAAAAAAARGLNTAEAFGGHESDDGGVDYGGFDGDDGVGGGDEYDQPPNNFNLADDRNLNSQPDSGEPVHVDALDIDYCRVAKKVDIKRVKLGMWEIISESTTESFPTDPSQSTAESAASSKSGLGITFSSLRSTLPNHIRANLNENLSTPTSFVALLHLCNDKDLHIAPAQEDDYSDFVIHRDVGTST